MTEIDVKENYILEHYPGVLEILLKDNSSKKNIIWASNNYAKRGKHYQAQDQIIVEAITGYAGRVIKPRISKSLVEQKKRSKDMAEVFTPAWMCNKQNNLIDEQWFGYKNAFNTEVDLLWKPTKKVKFKNGKKWEDYVDEERMEITCGEAPYLTSRYDVVYGEFIDPMIRIGLLDRKLRVISENVDDEKTWLEYARLAYKRIYGYDFQGDNVLVARENLLLTFEDFYFTKFNKMPSTEIMKEFAIIISWNIWQMDGMKYVVPMSCHMEEKLQITLSPEFDEEPEICQGCKTGKIHNHNGQYCYIKDWRENKKIRFVNLIK